MNHLHYKLFSRRLNMCSIYNFKIFKQFLKTKLYLVNKLPSSWLVYLAKPTQKNLIFNRREKFPLRLIRYYSILHLDLKDRSLVLSNIFVNTKLKIYNGRKFKPINVFRD